MLRNVLIPLIFLVSATAWAQGVDVRLGGGPGGVGVQVREHGTTTTTTTVGAPLGSDFALTSEPNPDRTTMLKIIEPVGAGVQVFAGKMVIHEDDVPTSFIAQPDMFYRVVLKLADGRVWQNKLQVKRGHTATLKVQLAASVQTVVVEHDRHERHHDRRGPPPGPVPMDDAQFRALKAAIDAEAFEQQKLAVLSTACAGAFFVVAQVGQLVDAFTFSAGKVKVVELTKPRILDMANAFQLYSHFTFDADKTKVKKILGQ